MSLGWYGFNSGKPVCLSVHVCVHVCVCVCVRVCKRKKGGVCMCGKVSMGTSPLLAQLLLLFDYQFFKEAYKDDAFGNQQCLSYNEFFESRGSLFISNTF